MNTYGIRYADGDVDIYDEYAVKDMLAFSKSMVDKGFDTYDGAEIVVLCGTTDADASWETLEDAGITL